MRGWRWSSTRLAVVAGAILGALAAAPAPARAQAVACRLVISATPRILGAGQASAQVFVYGSGRTLRLVASAGTIEDLRRETGETFAARFVPARDGLTRTALIGAVTDDGSCGLTTVRLADQAGGGPPLPPPVAVLLQAAPAHGEGDVEVQAWIFAVDDTGGARGGAAPALKVGAGTVSPAEPVCAGTWSARWRVPAGKAADELLTATFPGGAAGSARLGRRLAALEVDLDPSHLVRGSLEPVAVLVRGFDEARRPVDAEVTVTASAGTVSKPKRVEPGTWLAGLTVRPGSHAAGPVTVRARSGAIQAEAVLAFGPGEASVLRIEGPEAMVCDGTSAMLVVTVADAQGNAVDDLEPALEARLADLGVPHHAGPGQWWIGYRPRCAAEAARDLVVGRAGPATAERAIRLAAPATGFGLGPKVGLALGAGGTGLAVAAEAAAWTRLSGQQVGLALEVARWSVTSRGTLDPLGAYVNERTYLPVLLSAAWQRPLGGPLVLGASAGGGVAQVASSNRLAGQPDADAAGWAPAVSGSLSLGRWATHGVLLAEARATWIGDPGLPTLHGALTSFLLLAGYRFHGW